MCVCVCLKIPYLIYTVDSLTLTSQPAALWLILEGRSFSNTCTAHPYAQKHCQHYASCWGGGSSLTPESPTKCTKTQTTQHCTDNERETHPQYEKDNKKTEAARPALSWEQPSGGSHCSANLHMSRNDWEIVSHLY